MNAFALLFLLATSLQAPNEKTGPHFRVVCHVPGETLAANALETAEAVWPLALEALGRKDKELEAPMTIHLYPDVKSYEEVEAQLTGGAFKANLAFSHFASKSTHLVLQPPCTDEVLRAYGLPTLTRYLVGHEATHLVAYAFLPNSLDHPDWFAEGVANHVGLQALEKLGRTRKQIEEPLAAKSLQDCREMLAKGTLPTTSAILSGALGALELHPRYRVNYEFYVFLAAQEPKGLARVVQAISSTGGGPGYQERVLEAVQKIWSEKDLKKLDERFEDFLQSRKPCWDELYRSLETRGEGYVQRAFADKNAIAYRMDSPIERLPAQVTGTLRIWPGPSLQMNFLLGRTDTGFLSVAFTAGQGVTVFRYDNTQSDPWNRLAFGESKDLPTGADVPFGIEIEKNELAVYVSGKELVRTTLGGGSPLGTWGIGAQAGATGEWKGLLVKVKR